MHAFTVGMFWESVVSQHVLEIGDWVQPSDGLVT